MNILAIETSCDETAVAIVRDGRDVLANVIASQIGLHQRYGGVVPELASRQHIVLLIPALEEALQRAGLDWAGIDALAVTCGPGLAGALLVGLNAAKAIAFARQKPLIAVNHLEAHIYSNWIVPETLDAESAAGAPAPALPPVAERSRASAALRALGAEPPTRGDSDLPAGGPPGGRPAFAPPPPPAEVRPDLSRSVPTDPAFPLICLVVSGGHTELVYMSAHGRYSLLGKTVDDAAGEAFDKVARILGLPYPGGPAIQEAAQTGNPDAIELPRAVLRGSYDFSFSGLKTAALRQAQQFGPPLTADERAAILEEARQAAAARQEATARAQREEEEHVRREAAAARQEATARAQREEEERVRHEEERRLEWERRDAAARAQREEERRLEWERRDAAARARREEQEQARAAAAQQATEERDRRAAQQAAEERDRRAAPQTPTEPPALERGARPAISILGGSRPAASPGESLGPPPPGPGGRPAAPRPAAGPDAAEPPAGRPIAQAAPPPPPTPRPRVSGLIRVTPDRPPEEEAETTPERRFERPPGAPGGARPAPGAPRVLGKTEAEEIAPPPFLAERGGGTPPTPLRRRPAPAGEPELPAFLRARGTPGPDPAAPPAPAPSQNPAPRPAGQGQSSGSAPPVQGQGTSPQPRPSVGQSPGLPTPPAPTNAVAPRPTPAAGPPPARPGPPTPPLPRPAPAPPREVRPIPKSVQARPPRKEDEEGEEDDDVMDALLDAAKARGRDAGAGNAGADEDLGDDDDPPPPPRSGRRPVGLEGPRPPEARVPVTQRDKPPLPVADFAASFQAAAVEILVDKTLSAVAAYKVRTVLLAGGVAANLRLRARLQERLGAGITLRFPPPVLCTDNAAMVAAAAYFRYDVGLQHDWTLDIDPNARYVE